eukprot:6354221-Prymnesium_polylepis.1
MSRRRPTESASRSAPLGPRCPRVRSSASAQTARESGGRSWSTSSTDLLGAGKAVRRLRSCRRGAAVAKDGRTSPAVCPPAAPAAPRSAPPQLHPWQTRRCSARRALRLSYTCPLRSRAPPRRRLARRRPRAVPKQGPSFWAGWSAPAGA